MEICLRGKQWNKIHVLNVYYIVDFLHFRLIGLIYSFQLVILSNSLIREEIVCSASVGTIVPSNFYYFILSVGLRDRYETLDLVFLFWLLFFQNTSRSLGVHVISLYVLYNTSHGKEMQRKKHLIYLSCAGDLNDAAPIRQINIAVKCLPVR